MFQILSESELEKVLNWDKDFPEKYPERFQQYLYELGFDVDSGVEVQDGLTHRNKFGELVNCRRWSARERTDEAWLKSGEASLSVIYSSSEDCIRADMRHLMKTLGMQDPFEKERKQLLKDTLEGYLAEVEGDVLE